MDHLQKTKKESKNLKKREIQDQNELDKARFQHDMAYGDFKDFKAFNIAKNSKSDGYQRGIASMVYEFFDKKTSGSGIKNENISKWSFGLSYARIS